MPDFIRGFPEDSEVKGASQNQGKTKRHLIKLLWLFLSGLALVISQTLYSTSWKRRSIPAEAKLLQMCKPTCKCWLFGDRAANNDWGSFCTSLFSMFVWRGNEQVPLPGWRLVSLNFFYLSYSLPFFSSLSPPQLYLLLSMEIISQSIHQDTPQIVPWESMLARDAKEKDLGGEGREIMLWRKISKSIIGRFRFLKNKWKKE